MGLSTIAGRRVTHARVNMPAWGAWHADVAIDGDHELSGSVELKIADLTLTGTILSGGPSKGRSHFRMVAGAGGWGRVLRAKSYTTDSGVRLQTVLGDAATEAGETINLGSRSTERIGSAFVRQEGPAGLVLGLLAEDAWYIDEGGTTRLGRRATATLTAKATRVQTDPARRTVTLAAESISTILPGVIVDDIEAIDVEHEVTPKGLRSTIWGARGSTEGNTAAESIRKIVTALFPDAPFRGLSKYRVVTREGSRLNLQPVRVSTGMPSLRRVRVMPGVAGCEADVALGARVLVSFVDALPTDPVVVAFEDAEGDGFQPDALRLQAGGMAAGEHVMTVEGMTVFVHNLLFGLAALGLPASWLASGAITTVINAALAASNAPPAPPTAVAQVAAAPGIAAAMLSGPGTTIAPYSAAIASALSTKVANESGLFPSIGSKAVEAG